MYACCDQTSALGVLLNDQGLASNHVSLWFVCPSFSTPDHTGLQKLNAQSIPPQGTPLSIVQLEEDLLSSMPAPDLLATMLLKSLRLAFVVCFLPLLFGSALCHALSSALPCCYALGLLSAVLPWSLPSVRLRFPLLCFELLPYSFPSFVS